MVTLSPSIKSQFFDRAAVVRSVDATRRRFLSKAGAFVRRRARTSIRRRKYGTSAKPGRPPFAHATDPYATLKNILFAYDPATRSVVVGPVGLHGSRSVVPGLMEFGGTAFTPGKTVWKKMPAGRDSKGRFRVAGKRKIVIKGALRYKGNPFMRPALDAEEPYFPSHWTAALNG